MSKEKNKSQELIELLLSERNFITSEVLAEKLNISTKTVYRCVKSINEKMSDLPLIVSEKGRGYKLDYNQYLLVKGSNNLDNYSPEKRRWSIEHQLLLKAPKSISYYELIGQFFISESALKIDEKKIQENLSRFNLTLVKKNRTLAIEGTEKSVRQAILSSLQSYKIVDLVELEDNFDLNINPNDAEFLLREIEKIEEALNSRIPYPYNVNIFLHLYIMMERTRVYHNYELEIDNDDFNESNKKLLSIASIIIENIGEYIGHKISDKELFYLYQYLLASRLEDVNIKKIKFSNLVANITKSYISLMEQEFNRIMDSDSIFIDLASHIKPMLERLDKNILVKNGFLSQIKIIYGSLYKSVCDCSKKIESQYHLNQISDDENGFITLYFAKLIETNIEKIKTVIVCTTGVGISELLRVKVSNAFPEIEVVNVVSARELKSRTGYIDVELFISTIPLEINNEKILLISGMFSEDDKDRLRKKIKEIRNE